MHKMNVNKALIFLVVSALVAGVGCGSGKSTKRAKRDRPSATNNLANKARVPTPDNGGATGGGGAGNSGTEGDNKDKSPTLATDSVERKKLELRIEAIWSPLVAGTPINSTELEAGTYTFEESATEIRIMPNTPPWIQAVAVNSISNGQFILRNQEQIGMLPNVGDDSHAYKILLPAQFTVEKSADQPQADLHYILTSKFKTLPKTVTVQGLVDTIEDANGTRPNTSLLDLMMKKNSANNIVFKSWKSADSTKVRFQVFVEEIPKVSETSPIQNRTMILTYAFKAKPKATEASAPAATVDPASATANQPPATAPVEKIGVEIDEK